MVDRPGPFTVDAIDGDVRYRVLATTTADGVFVWALPLDDVDTTVERMIAYQLIGLAAVVVVLAAVAAWVIHLDVRPIRAMTDTAGEIADGDLSLRVAEPTAPGTESGDLARALNTMLGRIEDAVDEQARTEDRLRRFVADASHELRTPVTTIRGYAELYDQGGLAERHELDDAMRRTRQEAQRMGRLVEDMLTLAELDEERPDERHRVDMTALVADIAADARVQDPARTVVTDIDAELTVVGDEDRLRQVVANAVAHTPSSATVTLRAHRDGDDVVVEVIDDGPGMDPAVAARVTERFYRADPSRSRQRGGTGLGMSIAEAIVAAHDGSLSVDSRPGAGTTVRIALSVG